MRSYEALDKYIMHGDLNEALSIIGEVGVDAAEAALESSKLATNPREQVLLAIGHLQLAQAAYKRQWNINIFRTAANTVRSSKSIESFLNTTFKRRERTGRRALGPVAPNRSSPHMTTFAPM
jgi:hypothetical protein